MKVCILPSSSLILHLNIPFIDATICTPPIPFILAMTFVMGPTKSARQFEMHDVLTLIHAPNEPPPCHEYDLAPSFRDAPDRDTNLHPYCAAH
jgi:hypothetical protein